MPAANADPRRCTRPHNASAARTLASAYHASVWSGVSTPRPRLDRKRRGARRSRRERGQGSASGGGGKQRRDSPPIKLCERDRRTRQRRKAKTSQTVTRRQRRHQRRARGRRETSQAITLPCRTYVFRISTETRFMPIQARIWTEASVTTRRGRHGGMTSRSCHRGAMTRRVGDSGAGSSGRWGWS